MVVLVVGPRVTDGKKANAIIQRSPIPAWESKLRWLVAFSCGSLVTLGMHPGMLHLGVGVSRPRDGDVYTAPGLCRGCMAP